MSDHAVSANLPVMPQLADRAPQRLKYVLVAPARDEEALITLTLESVVAQTVLPERWVIVDDGSADRTADIVEGYTRRYSWIHLVRQPRRAVRHFGGKAKAFSAAVLAH